MRIKVVIDNVSHCSLEAEHGLCLFVEHGERRFFFDLGQSDMFLRNAEKMSIDVSAADFAIISHGHYDHGGGIAHFLEENKLAPVYLHRRAFASCYSRKEGRMRYIGLDAGLKDSPRLQFVDGEKELAEGLKLFSEVKERVLFSPANGRLYQKDGDRYVNDNFDHEQNVILTEGGHRVLLAGCAHSGIVNIIEKAETVLGAPITDVVGGLHLKGVEDEAYVKDLAAELKRRNCKYYTCHCTGDEAFHVLRRLMGEQIEYVSAGSEISI